MNIIRSVFCVNLLITAFLLPSTMSAQTNPLWSRVYGRNAWDYVKAIVATPEGDLIVGVSSASNGSADSDFWVFKVDNYGDMIWEMVYETTLPMNSGLQDLLLLDDGRLLLSGWVNTSGYYRDTRLIMTDSEGQVEWEMIHDDPGKTMYVLDSDVTSDGGFIFTGGIGNPTDDEDILLLKTDSLGSIEWKRSFPVRFIDYGQVVRETSDGGFVVGAHIEYMLDNTNATVFKTDSNGSLLWYHLFDSPTRYYSVTDIYETSDCGFMGLMYVSQPNVASFSMIFRMSADGDLLWYHGLNINETRSMDFVPVGNDSYVHTGATEIDDEMLLMETDSTGQQVWITTVELGSRYSSGHNLCQMPDGGFAVGGGAQEQAGFLDVWLVRFDNTVGIDEQQHSEQAGLICSCFPNPFKASTTVTYSLESPSEVTLSVYDVSGRLVDAQRNTEYQSLTGSMIWLPDETCSTGCYFIILEAGGQLASTSCVYIRE